MLFLMWLKSWYNYAFNHDPEPGQFWLYPGIGIIELRHRKYDLVECHYNNKQYGTVLKITNVKRYGTLLTNKDEKLLELNYMKKQQAALEMKDLKQGMLAVVE